jgi:anti-anti-sigma factor
MVDIVKSVEHRIVSDVLVITLVGSDFVVEQAQGIADLVFVHHDTKTDRIVVDMSTITYINSSGISVIIRMNLEKKLKVVNVSRPVRDILDLTGILSFLSEHDTVDEALADLQ